MVAGCQTPDLKPFAAASATIVASINRGGDQAIAPLAGQAAMVNGSLVATGSPEHPANKLQTLWTERRKAADAILVYSESLAAINDAAANRKGNATALIDSVRQLASAIPGVNVSSNAAGDLVIFAVSAGVEVKSWHDMSSAVKSADPAIQLLAGMLRQDLVALSAEFESEMLNQLMTSTVPALREVERLHGPLREKQRAQRVIVARDPSDATAGAELMRIDGLIAGLQPDLNALRAEQAQLKQILATGKNFYAAVGRAIDAWAAAHHDLVRVFEENRGPNLVLLAARAQELDTLIQAYRNEKKAEATP